MTSQKTITLGFDIERSGATDTSNTIAIGASVVDNDFTELDNLFLPGYIPGETTFETKCYDEFWSKNLDILSKLEYKGTKCKKDREFEMIQEFQDFRGKWEKIASENNWKLETVSDNNVFDGGFINHLIFKNLIGSMPLPYSTNGSYKPFWETHSMQRGLLIAVDPNFKDDWGFTKRIAELYEIPKMVRNHDHLPNNDAYTIAFDNQVLLGIRDGNIKLKN